MTDHGADPGHVSHGADTLPHDPAEVGAPTESLVAGTVGDRCVACGSPLSSDQRYCVVCGERRGASRFSLPVAPAQEETTRVRSTRVSRRGPRNGTGFGPGATLIAGVGTLLLAMLVGVLIGHNTANTKTVADAGPVRVIKINEGGSAPAASTSASGSSGSASSHKKSNKSSSKAKKHTPAVSKATAKKESSAATKVTGGNGGVPATVTVGSKGTGKGYNKKTHKFDGSFFGQ